MTDLLPLKKFAPWVLAAGLIAGFAWLPFQAAEAADSQSFVGSYDWSSGSSGSLEATFKPDGADDAGVPQWKVVFEFSFYKKDYTWKGTASGSLEDGATVEGTARGSRRDWVFSGTVADGVMTGDHAEIKKGGGRSDSGTFKISAR